ncbi:tetratricopeptide repeat protein [Desulfosudis oleivorans]|uniref:Tetratricopeptide repeat protein n=1 Tax=Desulfosudis oleivorans (strain DSM 6200 / JCM 39069 / Hxd3) TaxID=96561 RepID=A8ZWX2_DESOH|nr:hypothetical protein [Desulfosudis oleivorans]ABW66828.1 hypothetical protein Dole_1018 [Desulfosudis oleivorans Hxd3]
MKKHRFFFGTAGFAGLVFVFIFPLIGHAAYVWDRHLPVPDDDPSWKTVARLWDNRWDGGRVIEDLIAVLHGLEEKYPDRIEPCLWLGRAYYIKGRDHAKTRKKSFAKAEAYAVKAHQIDGTDLNAFYILLNALSNCTDREYVHSTYGDWIYAVAPLPTGELLPDMPPSEKWSRAIVLWGQRADIDSLSASAQLFETMAADHPENLLAQMWACYACYNWGEYYTFNDAHDEMGVPLYKKAIAYAEAALRLNPHSVQAHYWRQVSMARKIQTANILTQAAHLNPIMEDLLFCVRENPTYDSCGPVFILATMVIEGGWVCRKGMEMAGYTVEMLFVLLETAEILYPDQTYIPYIHARLLENRDRPEAALPVLERLIQKGPPGPNDPRKIEKTEYYKDGIRLHRVLSERLATIGREER